MGEGTKGHVLKKSRVSRLSQSQKEKEKNQKEIASN
jgi:hypothetical protein